MLGTKHKSVDEYISTFPVHTREVLEQVRTTIKSTAPEAEEMISYNMPGYKLHGLPLVYFAGYKNHIGFYPTSSGPEAFKKELSGYKQGRGSVQFPINEPMPLSLITKIVKHRIKETTQKAKEKLKKK